MSFVICFCFRRSTKDTLERISVKFFYYPGQGQTSYKIGGARNPIPLGVGKLLVVRGERRIVTGEGGQREFRPSDRYQSLSRTADI